MLLVILMMGLIGATVLRRSGPHFDPDKSSLVWTDFENGSAVRSVEVPRETTGATPYTAHFGEKVRHGYLISAQYSNWVKVMNTEIPPLMTEEKRPGHFATLVITQGDEHWKVFLNRGNPKTCQ